MRKTTEFLKHESESSSWAFGGIWKRCSYSLSPPTENDIRGTEILNPTQSTEMRYQICRCGLPGNSTNAHTIRKDISRGTTCPAIARLCGTDPRSRSSRTGDTSP